jgi:fermentation-respiration switch protein FrsA (DUF1100 family)
MITKTLLHIAIGYLLFCAILYLLQDKMLFVPTKNLEALPSDAGLQYQDVFFTSSDNTELHAWYIPSDKKRAVVLLSHGNGGNISHRIEKLSMLHALNLDVFIYDYRGYGKSSGTPTESGIYLDAMAAWDYITKSKGIKPEEIVLYGESLGSAVSIELASNVPVAAIIIEGGFTSLRELAQRLLPYVPARYLCRYDFDSLSKVKGLMYPKLFIHSIDDEIVPFTMGKRLFVEAPGPKGFLQLSGGHNDGFYISKHIYMEGIKAFLADIFEHK